MTNTVKFRLTERELTMLTDIAGDSALSGVLRQMIHDEYRRKKGAK